MKVLIFGAFDFIHQGHMNLFEQARSLGEAVELHAIISPDATVEVLKGLRPVHDEYERLDHVAAFVDRAHLGVLGDKYALIQAIEPDVVALGYDQAHYVDSLRRALASRGFEPRIVHLKAYLPIVYASSLLRELVTPTIRS